MSKMDNLRAMREAKYEAAKSRTTTGAQPARRPSVPKPAPVTAPTPATDEPPAGAPALCGHRNMSGRTCTREHGHAAKSHRYS
ncbi:hypothetical protein [Nocardioides alcanivorans]|uniref:hypothetical protein n=1 Tax=Nocardioides alcanivorans TaxID=2897352 RepID=UPI001F3C7CFB|nr:hypothetical protein [Nocardioides alcanivorans]